MVKAGLTGGLQSNTALFLEPASFQGGVSLHPLWSLVRDLFFTWGLLPLTLRAPFLLLTGLVAPSVLLSFRGGSLLLLLLVDTVCLPRPGALASTSPASTPLSSLRVCPLSESCESVEAAGRGEQEEGSGLYSWAQGGLPSP